MNLLLDTHAFIWWDDNYAKLPDSLLKILNDPQHTIYFSLASIWEMQIKPQLGKLKFDIPLRQKVHEQREQNGLLVLPITEDHIYALSNLSHHHKDPFDRLLIAQCQTEELSLVTHDRILGGYGVTILWD